MADNENSGSETTGNGGDAAQAAQGPIFAIKKIFVRDISFEVPGSIDIFNQSWQPQVSQDLNTQVDSAGENHFLITLKMTVTVKSQDTIAYLAEVHQAGLFQVMGMSEEQLKYVLTVQGPHVLYPYVREALDSLTVRGGFPPIAIPPINFEAIVARASADAEARAKAEVQTGKG